MPGKNVADAAGQFVHYFRESLSVITDQQLLGRIEGKNRLLFFNPPPKLELTKGGHLYMQVLQAFSVIPKDGGYKAHTLNYYYSLLDDPSEAGGYGIFTYQWHPDRTKKLTWPHLHVIPRNTDPYIGHRIHFPTARLCIEDFVYLLIRDYDIRPRMSHDEWRPLLNKNKSAFASSASWLFHKP